MPPRAPGTLSNGVLSLKFMQRGLSSTETPVQLDRAEIVDDSKWIIAQSKDRPVMNIPQKDGVSYEPSYVPFLYGNEDESGNVMAINTFPRGRRTFQDGHEATMGTEQDAKAPKSDNNDQEAAEEESKSGDVDSSEEEQVQTRRKPTTNAPLNSTSEQGETILPPQFLRPAGVDVPNSHKTSTSAVSAVSRREQLASMIANARKSSTSSYTPTPSATSSSTPVPQRNEYKIPKSISGGGKQRRKVDEVDPSQSGPRKKAKRQMGE
ncbi:SubName: Full=Uncharacterized protein {ECO:0000313/EMBL:CCA72124.1} [Serendipita indica DSM 11827]|nr:SubName: Full=Uncharacterized protein {ECO:0000313/EMBL:CCA72124.1} [Serendipita indica DSM 11827]